MSPLRCSVCSGNVSLRVFLTWSWRSQHPSVPCSNRCHKEKKQQQMAHIVFITAAAATNATWITGFNNNPVTTVWWPHLKNPATCYFAFPTPSNGSERQVWRRRKEGEKLEERVRDRVGETESRRLSVCRWSHILNRRLYSSSGDSYFTSTPSSFPPTTSCFMLLTCSHRLTDLSESPWIIPLHPLPIATDRIKMGTINTSPMTGRETN